MQAENIAFIDLDVENDLAARSRAHALNPRGSVPTITIDEELLIGFSPTSLESKIERAARRRSGS
jgi:glutaredoxin